MKLTLVGREVFRLRREPGEPARGHVDGLMVKLRAGPEKDAGKSAADVVEEIGPWKGETTEEIMAFLSEARKHGGSRSVQSP